MAVSFAFIGFGEAGSEVSAGLLDNGVERIQMYDILLDDPEAVSYTHLTLPTHREV